MRGWSPVRNHPVYVRGGQVPDWEESQVLAALAVSELQRLCSDGALQTAHDIWGNWTAGASHGGDSFFSGPLADKGLLGSPYSQHGIL